MQSQKRKYMFVAMTSKTHSLLTEIEIALVEYGVSQTKFGYSAVGDPAFVAKLRKGRQPRASTVEKVEATLEKLKTGGSL